GRTQRDGDVDGGGGEDGTEDLKDRHPETERGDPDGVDGDDDGGGMEPGVPPRRQHDGKPPLAQSQRRGPGGHRGEETRATAAARQGCRRERTSSGGASG